MIDYLEVIEVVYTAEVNQIIEIEARRLFEETTDFENSLTLY